MILAWQARGLRKYPHCDRYDSVGQGVLGDGATHYLDDLQFGAAGP